MQYVHRPQVRGYVYGMLDHRTNMRAEILTVRKLLHWLVPYDNLLILQLCNACCQMYGVCSLDSSTSLQNVAQPLCELCAEATNMQLNICCYYREGAECNHAPHSALPFAGEASLPQLQVIQALLLVDLTSHNCSICCSQALCNDTPVTDGTLLYGT